MKMPSELKLDCRSDNYNYLVRNSIFISLDNNVRNLIAVGLGCWAISPFVFERAFSLIQIN
jgi:hypothetical protein